MNMLHNTLGLIAQINGERPATEWSESGVAIAGIAMVTVIMAIAIWQVFLSLRARMSVAREEAYKKLAEESVTLERRLANQSDRVVEDVSELRTRVANIERLLQQID